MSFANFDTIFSKYGAGVQIVNPESNSDPSTIHSLTNKKYVTDVTGHGMSIMNSIQMTKDLFGPKVKGGDRRLSVRTQTLRDALRIQSTDPLSGLMWVFPSDETQTVTLPSTVCYLASIPDLLGNGYATGILNWFLSQIQPDGTIPWGLGIDGTAATFNGTRQPLDAIFWLVIVAWHAWQERSSSDTTTYATKILPLYQLMTDTVTYDIHNMVWIDPTGPKIQASSILSSADMTGLPAMTNLLHEIALMLMVDMALDAGDIQSMTAYRDAATAKKILINSSLFALYGDYAGMFTATDSWTQSDVISSCLAVCCGLCLEPHRVAAHLVRTSLSIDPVSSRPDSVNRGYVRACPIHNDHEAGVAVWPSDFGTEPFGTKSNGGYMAFGSWWYGKALAMHDVDFASDHATRFVRGISELEIASSGGNDDKFPAEWIGLTSGGQHISGTGNKKFLGASACATLVNRELVVPMHSMLGLSAELAVAGPGSEEIPMDLIYFDTIGCWPGEGSSSTAFYTHLPGIYKFDIVMTPDKSVLVAGQTAILYYDIDDSGGAKYGYMGSKTFEIIGAGATPSESVVGSTTLYLNAEQTVKFYVYCTGNTTFLHTSDDMHEGGGQNRLYARYEGKPFVNAWNRDFSAPA